uniref:CMP/dCMP-type deaminase domain-containing protein n=1 Tax=Callorhinchus milii TaxID=7868 RepID=A0A4W3GN99_CALMI
MYKLLDSRYLSKEKFYDGFNNASDQHYTLLCFQLKEDSKTIFKLWGYAINDQKKSHAEELVIDEMEQYIAANISHDLGKCYNITYYLSYGPCSRCCRKIIDFHRLFNNVSIDIKMSKSYCFQLPEVQNGVKNLLKENISLTAMDKADFVTCFYSFVEGGHLATFEPWPDLESHYQKFSEGLQTLQVHAILLYAFILHFYSVLQDMIFRTI